MAYAVAYMQGRTLEDLERSLPDLARCAELSAKLSRSAGFRAKQENDQKYPPKYFSDKAQIKKKASEVMSDCDRGLFTDCGETSMDGPVDKNESSVPSSPG